MTKDGSFKKVVRRHAHDTGQRYTEALSDLEGLEARLFHKPTAERLLAHLRDHYRIDAVAATKASRHNDQSSASTARRRPLDCACVSAGAPEGRR